jgi:hypothetical protein
LLRGVKNRSLLLQRRRDPFIVVEAHTAVAIDFDDDHVHGFNVQAHHQYSVHHGGHRHEQRYTAFFALPKKKTVILRLVP